MKTNGFICYTEHEAASIARTILCSPANAIAFSSPRWIFSKRVIALLSKDHQPIRTLTGVHFQEAGRVSFGLPWLRRLPGQFTHIACYIPHEFMRPIYTCQKCNSHFQPNMLAADHRCPIEFCQGKGRPNWLREDET